MRFGTPAVLLVAVSLACGRTAPRAAEGVADLLRAEVVAGRTPSVQYRFFNEDSVLYAYDHGLADVGTGAAVTPHTTYHGLSITKTVTAVAILQLAERGLLGLDDAVATLLPERGYPGDITVRHLLAHSAGLANPLPLRWIHLDEDHDGFDRDEFFRPILARHVRPKRPPNRRFAYSNLGYVLLGQIVEAVSGERYEDYVSGRVLAPLGLTAADLGFSLDPAGHARGHQRRASVGGLALRLLLNGNRHLDRGSGRWQAFRPYHVNGASYGGIIGTADGFVRFAQALLDPASGLLSEESRHSLFEENILAGGRASGMSMAWFTGELNGRAYRAHAGGGGGYYAELRIYPGEGLGSVILFNRTGMTDRRFLDRVDAYLLGS